MPNKVASETLLQGGDVFVFDNRVGNECLVYVAVLRRLCCVPSRNERGTCMSCVAKYATRLRVTVVVLISLILIG
jgi:hypothetical protein